MISAVDTSKTNGYAFEGQFLTVQAEHKIDEGSLVVEACGDNIALFRIEKDGKVELAKAVKNKMSGLIEKAAEELKNKKPKERSLLELLARKEDLLKQLEEIDNQIAELNKN